MMRLDLLIFIGAMVSIWPAEVPWSSMELDGIAAAHGLLRYRLLPPGQADGPVSGAEPPVADLHAVGPDAGDSWRRLLLAGTEREDLRRRPVAGIHHRRHCRVWRSGALDASIAALLVGEDEKRLNREMHADLRMLRKEISMLRAELAMASCAPKNEQQELLNDLIDSPARP